MTTNHEKPRRIDPFLLFFVGFLSLLGGYIRLFPALMSDSPVNDEWVDENIPTGARFLLLTGDQPLGDPVSEWFPALTRHASLATVQGHEWQLDSDFDRVLRASYTLQQCVIREADCLQEWQRGDGREYDYLYLSKALIRANHPALGQTIPLLNELLESGNFEMIYDSKQTVVLKKR